MGVNIDTLKKSPFLLFFEPLRKRGLKEREISSLALVSDEDNLIVEQNSC